MTGLHRGIGWGLAVVVPVFWVPFIALLVSRAT